jgi:hypothetical protein
VGIDPGSHQLPRHHELGSAPQIWHDPYRCARRFVQEI